MATVRATRFLLLPWLLIALTSGAHAQAERKEESWKPLTTELSRDELFSQYADKKAKSEKLASLAFPYAFHFSRDAIYDTDGTPRTNSIFGSDISRYQGDNFPFDDPKRQHVAFLYAKATQGTDIADKSFGQNAYTGLNR
jgi:lysozyme